MVVLVLVLELLLPLLLLLLLCNASVSLFVSAKALTLSSMLIFAVDSLALLLKSIVFAFDVDVIGVVTVTVAIDSVADKADDGIDTVLVRLIAATILLLPVDILFFVFIPCLH